MRIQPSLDPMKTEGELKTFFHSLRRIWEQLARAFNGNISFGDGTRTDNISGQWLTAVFAAPNADVNIAHKLGRVPVAYIVMQTSAGAVIYNGSIAWTTTQITLKASAISNATLFVL